jgi:hypothetical protein
VTQPLFETTAAALREKSKLRRHFRRFDMFFYLICTVVTIDTIGAVASNRVAAVRQVGADARRLGGTTRRETAAEPVAPAYVPAQSQAESPERAS